MQVLEQIQPDPPMLPPEGSAERQRAAQLMRLERRLFSDWLQWLCNGWWVRWCPAGGVSRAGAGPGWRCCLAPAASRLLPPVLRPNQWPPPRPPAIRSAVLLAPPARPTRCRGSLAHTHTVPCRGHESNRDQFCRTMDVIDKELREAPGPYFLSEFGLVDITFAPFLERIVSSLLYYKGFVVRGEVRGKAWGMQGQGKSCLWCFPDAEVGVREGLAGGGLEGVGGGGCGAKRSAAEEEGAGQGCVGRPGAASQPTRARMRLCAGAVGGCGALV